MTAGDGESDEASQLPAGARPTSPPCTVEWAHGGYARIRVATEEAGLELAPLCERLREVAPAIGSFYALSGRIMAIATSLGLWAEVSTNPDASGDWVILAQVRRPFGLRVAD